MKTILRSVIVSFALCALVLTGCKKESDTVDTAKLERSFTSAEPSTKATVDQVVTSIKSQDYGSAAASLQKLAGQAKLTPEQQKAVSDVLADLQKKFTEAVDKAAEQGKKAIDDLKGALPKP